MADKKLGLTLSDLLNQGTSASNDGIERTASPLGDRQAIAQRTGFMRQKTDDGLSVNAPAKTSTADVPELAVTEAEPTASPAQSDSSTKRVGAGKGTSKPVEKAADDKVTRSIQFSRATYRQMEKTLNFIAYKSGRRNVSFPKYFKRLHEMVRQQPDLMNQLIDYFKTDLPD